MAARVGNKAACTVLLILVQRVYSLVVLIMLSS